MALLRRSGAFQRDVVLYGDALRMLGEGCIENWEELAPKSKSKPASIEKSKSEPLKLIVREPTPVVLGL